jgi:O-antigen/teichoic acid export membrane protein
MVSDLGLGSALIQAPSLRRADLRKATVICACSGLILSGLTFALAPWISRAFQGAEQVQALLRPLALCALLHPVGVVPRARMTREMDFRRLALIDAGAALAAAAAAVALALHGAGAHSLAWGYVVRVAVSSGLAWIVADRGPDPPGGAEGTLTSSAGRGDGARDLLRFGLPATGAGLLNYLAASVDYLLVGRYLGPTALGLYYLAYQLVSLAHFKVVSVLLRVLLPAFATVQGDLDRLRRGYLRAVRGIALFAFPVLALLCALSREVVAVFYGPGKEAAGPLVQILCVLGTAKAVGGAVGPVFLARGRADIALLWNGFALATTTVAVAAGLPFGLEGVTVAVSLNALLLLGVSEGIVHRLLPLGFRAYLAALTPALLAASVAGMAVGLGMTFVRLAPVSALPSGAAFGAALYLALIRMLDREALSEALALFRSWRG